MAIVPGTLYTRRLCASCGGWTAVVVERTDAYVIGLDCDDCGARHDCEVDQVEIEMKGEAALMPLLRGTC